MGILDRILRAGEGKKLKALEGLVPDINARSAEIAALSDDALRGKTAEFRNRIERGESLDDAGEMTGIHPYHIEAIEYGDMTRMPERMEALEMIGTYAHYLGFDPEPLVVHYAQFLPRPAIAPKANHPANPAPDSDGWPTARHHWIR